MHLQYSSKIRQSLYGDSDARFLWWTQCSARDYSSSVGQVSSISMAQTTATSTERDESAHRYARQVTSEGSNCILGDEFYWVLDSVDASGCRLEPKSLVNKVKSLNLFPSEVVTREELLATRIYLGLFAVCLIAAFLYAGPLNTDTKIIESKSPTPTTVDDLHTKNLSTLSCPCSRAAVNYSTFLSITPHFHPICFSDFVLPSHWSELLARNDSVSAELTAHYRVLASLCQQAHRTVENAQILFGARELISMETLTHLSFNNQTHSFLSGFIADLPADFSRKLSFTIGSFGVNQLLNRFTSNWEVAFTGEDEKYIIATHPRRFSSSNCSCATSSKCFEQLAPNVFSGCFPFDGFRRSKLQNLSISALSDQLFITRWDNNSNYDAYFDTCRPTHCQYTVSDRYDLVHIFTTVLGLYGGKEHKDLHDSIKSSCFYSDRSRSHVWASSNCRSSAVHLSFVEIQSSATIERD